MENRYGKHVLVTGASSGIGKACAIYFAKHGCQVIGVSRNCKERIRSYENNGTVTMRKLDVTDEAAVRAFVEGIPQIDIAILSAGMGVAGAIEDLPLAMAHEQMEVNYFGVLNVCNYILPKMHGKQNGLLLVIGSVAGRVAIPMQAHYSSSKYALEAYVDALRMEVKPYGIRATIIEPGDVKTGFTENRQTYIKGNSDYDEMVSIAVGKMEEDEEHGGSPLEVAKTAWKLTGYKNPPARVVVGFQYKMATVLTRFLPDSAKESLLRKVYMKRKN